MEPSQEELGKAFAVFTEESVEWAKTNAALLAEVNWEYPPDPPQAKWRIWSNVHQQWFLPEARGYTPHIEKSGRFMPMEALQIYENSARGWDPHRPFSIAVTLVPV